MSEIVNDERVSIVRTFCLRCNCEVMQGDIHKDSTFIVNGDGNIVRIDDRLLHRGCGGIIRSLLLDRTVKSH